jgi:alpha-beta hydrolase superfamily lysophospholipase
MRRLGRFLGRVILVLIAAFGLAWATAPNEPVDREIAFDDNVLGSDLDAYLQQAELQFSDIRAGESKRIIWAGAKGAKTPLAVVYVHGFSAGTEEIRPVPDQVAAGLGANLFFTRLAGHGRTGEAMATATAGDWIEDLAEAMAIGRRLGDRVIVISTSTGGTLSTIGASDPALSEGLAGVVLVSPNFGVKNAAGKILDLPWARVWGPIVAGETRSFEPDNEGQAKHWTTSYPTVALFPMAALVSAANALDHGAIKTPILAIFSPDDRVVSPDATRAVLGGWGGPVQIHERKMGPGDDPYSHVIAGDILSPGQTAETVTLILAWAKAL